MISARVITSKKVRYGDVYRGEIEREMLKTSYDVRKNFEAIVSDWRHKPRFEVIPKITRHRIQITIKPTDTEFGWIFDWVDYGTRPHRIMAKNVPYLKFRWPYFPRTSPRPGRFQISSGGGTYGPNWATKRSVRHPGTEPRNFSKQLAEYWKKEARRRIDRAIARARRRAS